MWQLYVAGAVISGAGVSLITKHVLKEECFVCYAFLFQFLSALFFVPLVVADARLPAQLEAWGLALVACCLYFILSLVSFESFKLTDVSIIKPWATSPCSSCS